MPQEVETCILSFPGKSYPGQPNQDCLNCHAQQQALAERFGGLDVIEDWERVFSMGEQQRVAFARLLLTQPRYAILDEATSALDVKNEQNLYKHLQSLSTTYISVGHRPTLLQYHQQLLDNCIFSV